MPDSRSPRRSSASRTCTSRRGCPSSAIIFVVFGILGLLFVTRSATGAPHIGQDHWHATYSIYVCGEKQPNAPTWEAGVHTHGDGVIHIHPFTASEEGAGARMVKWFEYGRGKLTQSEMREPGITAPTRTATLAPTAPGRGQEGDLQVFVNSAKLDDWSRYIPHDGDRIRIIFGPEQAHVQLDDRSVIDETEATREVDITISGDREQPRSSRHQRLQMKAGETVKLLLHQHGHAVPRHCAFAGPDAKYNTADDFVAVPVGSDPKTAERGRLHPARASRASSSSASTTPASTRSRTSLPIRALPPAARSSSKVRPRPRPLRGRATSRPMSKPK